MELTFNLEELFKADIKVLSFGEELKRVLNNPKEQYQNFIKPKDRKVYMKSGFLTTSSQIIEFLENKLGAELDREFHNHRRNQLNSIIKKIVPTQRGKRTKLGYYQFRDLILLDDFNRFVLNNFNPNNVKDEKKMYEEIMYLQQNKFKETQLYKAQKIEDTYTSAYALNLVSGLGEFLKQKYCLFLYLLEHDIFYGDIDVSDRDKELLEIISYRYRQTSVSIYKFDSEFDVNTTNDEQMIRFFLSDIDSWANEIIDR